MKKSKLIINSVIFLVLLTGSAFAFGPGMGTGGEGCRGYMGENTWNDLSKEQKDELTALRQKFIDETVELKIMKHQKQQEMRLLMETSNPDRAKLSKLSGEILDIEKQFMEKQIDFQLSAKKISPEITLGGLFGRGHGKRTGRGENGEGFRGQEGRDCPYRN